jgi:hypothetical protein
MTATVIMMMMMTIIVIMRTMMTVTQYKEKRLSKILVRFGTIYYFLLELRKGLRFSVTIYKCVNFEVVEELRIDNAIKSILKSV